MGACTHKFLRAMFHQLTPPPSPPAPPLRFSVPGYGTAATVLNSPEVFLKLGVPAFLSNLNLLPQRNLTAVISEASGRCSILCRQ